MASIRVGGSGVPLNLTNALGGPLPQQNTAPVIAFNPSRGSNVVTMNAGTLLIIPAGTYWVAPGPYTSLLFMDPVTQVWRPIAAAQSMPRYIDSDGANFALGNLTGCAIGGLVTTSGSGYTNGIGTAATTITCTAGAGGSVWVPVVGGAINSTVTITNGGTGYLYPPLLVFDAPPTGGIQASGYCALSAGVINSVTVTNQGAGYVTAPAITLINDQRDNVGSGGVLTVNATLVNSGGLTALYPSNYGTAVTSVPTLTITTTGAGENAAATAIMNFVVTGYTVGTAGVAYSEGVNLLTLATGGLVSGRAANTAGPIADVNLTLPRTAVISSTTTSGGATQTGGTVVDAGFGFQAVPNLNIVNVGIVTTQAVWTATVGGIVDTSFIQPV